MKRASITRLKTIVCLFFLFCALIAFGHGGRLDRDGGHYNRETGHYHYHNGNSKAGWVIFSLIVIILISASSKDNKK